MSAWVREVPRAEIVDGCWYFVGRRSGLIGWMFLAEDIHGRRVMSQKPGIAVRVEGSDELRAFLEKHADHSAIAIPADAEKRWKRRRRSLR